VGFVSGVWREESISAPACGPRYRLDQYTSGAPRAGIRLGDSVLKLGRKRDLVKLDSFVLATVDINDGAMNPTCLFRAEKHAKFCNVGWLAEA